MEVSIYTDGSCFLYLQFRPGSWGFVLLEEGTKQKVLTEGSGYEENTTNNRMEMQAVISAFDELLYYCSKEEIDPADVSITLYSDSMYLINGYTLWFDAWKKRDFKRVKNDDLWRKMRNLGDFFSTIDMKWVKGHSGDKWNEYVDTKCSIEVARGMSLDPAKKMVLYGDVKKKRKSKKKGPKGKHTNRKKKRP